MQREVSRGFAAVNGARLYYEETGEGAPVLFVHGLCLDTRMWDGQADALAERFRVIRYDARGFGKSTVPDGEFRHADDLHALLEYLNVPAVHVVGLSMGGRIALQHTVLYPEATTSLVLVDSALDDFEWSDAWDASLDAIEQCAQREGAQAANQMWLEHELFAPARERPECAAQLATMVGEYSGWIWAHDSPARGIDPPARARLGELRVPALVIVGERDLPDFHTIADVLADGIPNAQKIVLAGVGHMANMENPAAFNAELARFLTAQAGPS